jgi:ATP-dependent Clp protease ATP-binding subunit ClpA
VGKTATARAVSKLWFNNPYDERIIVINMSEFSESHTLSKIIGSPPGYVGYGEQSLLPHRIINTGRTIIVFDEIEKAHRKVVEALLGALSEGKMSARNGERGAEDLYFDRSLFIFTSNAGSQELEKAQNGRELGFGKLQRTPPNLKKVGENAIKRFFLPEFLGRVDQIMYQPLTHESHLKILDLFIDELNARIIHSHSTQIWLTDTAKELLVQKAGLSKYGGRGIKSQFKTDIVTVLADFIASEQVDENNSLVIDANQNQYIYRFLPTIKPKTRNR